MFLLELGCRVYSRTIIQNPQYYIRYKIKIKEKNKNKAENKQNKTKNKVKHKKTNQPPITKRYA